MKGWKLSCSWLMERAAADGFNSHPALYGGDGMTDRERVVKRLREKIKEAHDIEYDFVHITVGTARVIVRLLEEQERVEVKADE